MNSSTKGDRMSFSNLGGEEAKDDQRLLDSPDRFNKEENDEGLGDTSSATKTLGESLIKDSTQPSTEGA